MRASASTRPGALPFALVSWARRMVGRVRGVDAAAQLDEAAAAAEVLSAMLSAGLDQRSALRHLSQFEGIGQATRTRMAAAALAASQGRFEARRLALDPVTRVSLTAWRPIALAWHVASANGSPLSGVLAGIGRGLREQGRIERQAASAAAGPQATQRLVLALPLVSIAMSSLIGFDVIGTVRSNPAAQLVVLVGCALMLAGWLWSRALVRRATRHDHAVGLATDLVAAGLRGGAALSRVIASVKAGFAWFDRPPRGSRRTPEMARGHDGRADGSGRLAGEWRRIRDIAELAERAGIGAAGLLSEDASAQRQAELAAGERRSATLGITLLIPLGVCVLPAYVLLAVVPLIMTMLAGVHVTP